jgi:hypothetical protein
LLKIAWYAIKDGGIDWGTNAKRHCSKLMFMRLPA